jgi:hypothetical protein
MDLARCPAWLEVECDRAGQGRETRFLSATGPPFGFAQCVPSERAAISLTPLGVLT